MDASLLILVRHLTLSSNLTDTTLTVEWGGQTHRQEPRKYSWGNSVQLSVKQGPIQKMILREIPAELHREDWLVLRVNGSALDQLSNKIHDRTPSVYSNEVEDFLKEQLHVVDDWVVAFLWESEQVMETFEANDTAGVVSVLERQLAADSSKRGFVAFHFAANSRD